MEYLLDTHTFLWFINGDEQLSKKARSIIANQAINKFISIASFWEIAIKINIGKLSLQMPFTDLREQASINGFEILPITFEHTFKLSALESFHGDPFDRIIIAQSLVEGLTVISKDKKFSGYKELQLLW